MAALRLTGAAAWTILPVPMFLDPSVAASVSLADPPGASVLLAAVSWIQGTLLGTVATAVAVLAVASIGFLMLAGRIDVRRGLTVVLGAFILFGAATLAAALQSLGQSPDEVAAFPVAEAPPVVPAPPTPSGYDPYAGASVPTR